MTATSRVFTRDRVGGDIVIRELERGISREEINYDNTGSANDLTIPAGTGVVVASNSIPAAAAINTVTGVTIEPVVVPGRSKMKIAVLAHGPAVVNGDALPTVDIAAGASITMATFRTALAAVGITVRREPTKLQEQTT